MSQSIWEALFEKNMTTNTQLSIHTKVYLKELYSSKESWKSSFLNFTVTASLPEACPKECFLPSDPVHGKASYSSRWPSERSTIIEALPESMNNGSSLQREHQCLPPHLSCLTNQGSYLTYSQEHKWSWNSHIPEESHPGMDDDFPWPHRWSPSTKFPPSIYSSTSPSPVCRRECLVNSLGSGSTNIQQVRT